tara:strand:- start:478 stop:765 length:288 start_codon:yes stop_codon:yes gene_type:complete
MQIWWRLRMTWIAEISQFRSPFENSYRHDSAIGIESAPDTFLSHIYSYQITISHFSAFNRWAEFQAAGISVRKDLIFPIRLLEFPLPILVMIEGT